MDWFGFSYALMVAGLVVMLLGHALVARRAFQESLLHGLASLLPPYAVYFLLARTWPRDRRFSVPLIFAGMFVQLAGAITLMVVR